MEQEMVDVFFPESVPSNLLDGFLIKDEEGV